MEPAPVPPNAVAEQLERVLQSEVFRNTGRSSKLLRFLVDQTLNGQAERLKDYTLGSEALGRGEDFDPRTDPIARVEASRLRSRLELYYATEGASDTVLITLPKGGYVPLFEYRSPIQSRPASRQLFGRLMWSTLALFVAAAIAGSIFWWRSASEGQPPIEMRLEITTPATTDPVSLAISPDGKNVVFVASSGSIERLWLRPLNATSARPLAGTEHASLPFWSPDSKSVCFFADDGIKRIEIESGIVQVLRPRPAAPSGGTWNEDGLIVYAGTPDRPLLSFSLTGNVAGPVTDLAPGQTGHRGPQFLPDGHHFIYFAMGSPSVRGVYVGNVERTVSRRLLDADTPAAYLANHLLFVRQGTLLAQRFDPERLELKGDPRPVGERVVSGTRANIAALSTSPAGLIAYRMGPSGGRRQLVWVNRSGREMTRIGDPHGFGPSYMSMSPDNRRLAVQRTQDGNTDIWLLDLDQNTPVRFTSDLEPDIAPVWSPVGDRIVFSSRKDRFNLYSKSIADSAAEELLPSEQTKSATDWSRDGRFLLYRSLDPQSNWDVWAMRMQGDRKPFMVVRTKFEERDARFSPDGKWIAYQSNESGRFEIYAQPFQGTGARRRISTDGGVQPQWSRDGREIFYLALDGRLVAAPVDLSPNGAILRAGPPVPLFVANVGGLRDIPLNLYLVSSDSQRFLLDTIVEEAASPIVVVVNWKPPTN